jgi:2-dehydropantoate 2-reductase
VLEAAGLAYATAEERAQVRGQQVEPQPVAGSRRGGSSSWQSLTRGTGSIEADFLNGEIVLLAREHGLAAPVNEVLQRLANLAARQRQAPGAITPGEITALIDAPAAGG